MTEALILEQCATGVISPQIALSRLLLAGVLPDAALLRRTAAERGGSAALAEMAALAERHRDRLPALHRLSQTGLWPEGDDIIAETARLFDRLAADAPEAGVAFYSFGDPHALEAVTAELVQIVRSWAPPAGRRVLDFGCGIGRLATVLADEAAYVLGLDVSAGMVAEARRRAGERAGLLFLKSNGRDLTPATDAGIDLLIAVDSLPFIIRANIIVRFMEEAARVLTGGGDLLVFNWSFRGDPELDRREAQELAPRFGFVLLRAGEQPFRIWDGAGFHFRRL